LIRFILITISVLSCRFAAAQYTFNRIYPDNGLLREITTNIVLFEDTTYLIPTVVLAPEIMYYAWRKLDKYGNQISLQEILNSQTPIYSGNKGSFIRLEDGDFLQTMIKPEGSLAKIQPDGNILWASSIDTLDGSEAALELADGNYMMMGGRSLYYPWRMIWSDTTGAFYRIKEFAPYDSAFFQYINYTNELSNGDLLVGGSVNRNNLQLVDFFGETYTADNVDLALSRTDSLGNIIWAKHWHDELNDGAIRYVISDDESTAVSYIKHTTDYDSTTHDHYPYHAILGSFVIDLETGDSSDVIMYGDTLLDPDVKDMVRTPDGGYAILGGADYGDYPITYAFICKLDEDRQFEWFKEYTYGIEEPEDGALLHPYDLAVTLDGGLIVAGYYEEWSSDGWNLNSPWVFKTDACGNLDWTDCSPIGVFDRSETLAQLIIYPNPAQDWLQIKVPKNCQSKTIRVFDMAGQLHSQLSVRANTSQLQLDISSLPSGLYLLQVESETGWVESARFVVE
jgi:hypothetical protein